jgi:methylase of polypeptide subunit release factors
MDCYRRLSLGLSRAVSSGSLLLCEIDQTQGQAMTDLFAPIAREVRIMKDLAGKDRLVSVVF